MLYFCRGTKERKKPYTSQTKSLWGRFKVKRKADVQNPTCTAPADWLQWEQERAKTLQSACCTSRSCSACPGQYGRFMPGYLLLTAFLFPPPLGTTHSLTDQVQSYTEDTPKSQLSRQQRLEFPGRKLQGPPESCPRPSVTTYLLSRCITEYHFILVNTPSFYQHFSKQESDAPQAVNGKRYQTPKLQGLKLKRLTPPCLYIWPPETIKQPLLLKPLESSKV